MEERVYRKKRKSARKSLITFITIVVVIVALVFSVTAVLNKTDFFEKLIGKSTTNPAVEDSGLIDIDLPDDNIDTPSEPVEPVEPDNTDNNKPDDGDDTETNTKPTVKYTTPSVIYSYNNSTVMKSSKITISLTGDYNKVYYVWSTSKTKPTKGWKETANNATLTQSKTGKYYLWIKLDAKQGADVVMASKVQNIDATKPTISLSNPSSGSFEKATKYTTINIVAKDSGGIAKVEYAWSDVSASQSSLKWTTGTSTSYTTEGIKKLWYRATDKAGNVTTRSDIYKVDATKPTIGAFRSQIIPSYGYNGFFKISDNLSADSDLMIYYVWAPTSSSVTDSDYTRLYDLSNHTDEEYNSNIGKKFTPLSAFTPGVSYKLYIKVIDEAGNINFGQCTSSYRIT